MSLRLTQEWVEWIDDFLPTITQDKVRYDLGLVLNPENGAPAVVLTFFAPGPLLGTTMHSIAILPNPGNVAQENIQQVLRGMVEALAQERTKQLTQMAQGAGPPGGPGTSGPGGPPLGPNGSGLIGL